MMRAVMGWLLTSRSSMPRGVASTKVVYESGREVRTGVS